MYQWFAYIGKRIFFAIIALFVLITIIYFLMDLLPYLPIQQGDKESTQQFHERLEALGLTQSVWARYFDYLGGLFTGNFGLYYENTAEKINTLFFTKVPATIYIAGMAFIFSIIIGFIFGIISAVYRGKFLDVLINVLSVVFVSVPSFIFAIILLKIGGMIGFPLTFVSPGDHDYSFGKMILSSILPVTVLIFGLASTLTYYVRNELVDVLNQEYIKTAKAKGLSDSQVLWKHALRNILIPALSVIGPSFLYIISGSVVIENFFGVSGIATLLVNGITMRETNLIVFQALFFSGLYFAIQIILDVSYTFIDPRIKMIEASNSIVFISIFGEIRRIFWKRKWLLTSTSQSNYLWVQYNGSLHKFLYEHRRIHNLNWFNKFIIIEPNDLNIYQELSSKKYLILGKEIFKIKHKGFSV